MGSGRGLDRGEVLGLYAADPVLSWVGTIGLAGVAGTALLIDLVGSAVRGDRTLEHLVQDGPRLDELSPGRMGIAVVSGGAMTIDGISGAVESLRRIWPALVIRSDGERWLGSTVPYKMLYPGALAPTDPSPAVWQACRSLQRPPGPGPVLPPLRPASVRSMLNLNLPRTRTWSRSWRRVWEMPWA